MPPACTAAHRAASQWHSVCLQVHASAYAQIHACQTDTVICIPNYAPACVLRKHYICWRYLLHSHSKTRGINLPNPYTTSVCSNAGVAVLAGKSAKLATVASGAHCAQLLTHQSAGQLKFPLPTQTASGL
jgi:hypothetical protein